MIIYSKWNWFFSFHLNTHLTFAKDICSSFLCKHGGTCIDLTNGTAICKCMPEFYGNHCEYGKYNIRWPLSKIKSEKYRANKTKFSQYISVPIYFQSVRAVNVLNKEFSLLEGYNKTQTKQSWSIRLSKQVNVKMKQYWNHFPRQTEDMVW